MKEEILNIFKEKQKQSYGKVLAACLCVVAITLMVLILQWFIEGAFIGFTLIVALPLVIIPFLFCALMATNSITRHPDYNFRQFYQFYMIGITGAVRSSFRVLVNFLKSYLILILTLLAGFLILYFIPDYHAEISKFFDSVRELKSLNEIYRATDEFLTSDMMLIPYTIIVNVSYGAAFFFFIYSILGNCIYATMKANCMLPNGKKQPVFKEVFAKYKKDYYKVLFQTNWYYFIVPVLGFIGSAALCMVYGHSDISLLVAVLVSIILFIPVLPNLLILNDTMFDMMRLELQTLNSSYMTDLLSKVLGGGEGKELGEEEKSFMDRLMNTLQGKKDDESIDIEFKETDEDNQDEDKTEQDDNQDDSSNDKNIEDK